MDSGWIKSYRKVFDNPVVCKDPAYFIVWFYLLLNATHKEMKIDLNGASITLKPGQLVTGRNSISSKTKVSESKVQRILKRFEIEQQIEQQTNNKNRVITILSWCEYQNSEQQIEQQLNNKRTTTEQQLNTNKNVKKLKNDNNEKNINIINKEEIKKEKEIQFRKEAEFFKNQYGEEMIKEFSDYWTESNSGSAKLKFEFQKTFDISRRLVTWNNNNFNKNGNGKTENHTPKSIPKPIRQDYK